jgi:hypothetical protein
MAQASPLVVCRCRDLKPEHRRLLPSETPPETIVIPTAHGVSVPWGPEEIALWEAQLGQPTEA